MTRSWLGHYLVGWAERGGEDVRQDVRPRCYANGRQTESEAVDVRAWAVEGVPSKSRNNPQKFFRFLLLSYKKNDFLFGGACRNMVYYPQVPCIWQKKFYYICFLTKGTFIMRSKNLNKRDFVDGLYVEGGRLINDRPNSMTGIQKAASIKRSVKNDRSVNQIAEAIELAEGRKNFRELRF